MRQGACRPEKEEENKGKLSKTTKKKPWEKSRLKRTAGGFKKMEIGAKGYNRTGCGEGQRRRARKKVEEWTTEGIARGGMR